MTGTRGPVGTALAAAGAWLLEPPAEAALPRSAPPPVPAAARPVIVVAGLAPRCGCSTVARGLGAALAARDSSGACAVASAGPGGGPRLGHPGALRLARVLEAHGLGPVRAAGRLCLLESGDPVELTDRVRTLAPVILDVGRDPPGRAAACADQVVLVAQPGVEPALAAVVAEALARVGPAPVVVLNRGPGGEGWQAVSAYELPESRMGARLALSGRGARGPLGEAVAAVADRCGA